MPECSALWAGPVEFPRGNPIQQGWDEWHPLVPGCPELNKTAKPMGSPALWAGSFTLMWSMALEEE
jgi:hypothetical protein